MKPTYRLLATTFLVTTAALPTWAQAESIPSVIVSIENAAPARGTFQTPLWIGIHDGNFDSYNGGEIASSPLGGVEIERLAEDGDTGPISDTFDDITQGGPQATVAGPGGPLAPGDRSTITLQVDPAIDRYFSYASMVIPSNDAFAANGNPLAHLLFDEAGNFVGEGFIVGGSELNDAGTELNDEIAENTAFLNQAGGNIGVTENLPVATPHPGLASAGTLSYPDGVLNHPALGNGDFNASGYRVLQFGFQYVDLGGTVRFRSDLSPDQEVQEQIVDSPATGRARIVSRDANEIRIRVSFEDLTGPLVAAHLHLGQAGVNGPIVVDMGSGIQDDSVIFRASIADVEGPLGDADDPLLALLNELAAGNIYINLHTAQFPAGELRGQVALR